MKRQNLAAKAWKQLDATIKSFALLEASSCETASEGCTQSQCANAKYTKAYSDLLAVKALGTEACIEDPQVEITPFFGSK